MGLEKSPKKLAKFLSYILGRRPDEFGLIPDVDGYVKIKELLKAMNEEEGWRHVRRASIDEVIISIPAPPVEIDDNRIRAEDRENLPLIKPAEDLPRLLYTCVRKKAHPVVLDKGISPLGGYPYVILSSDQKLAQRMGKRIDSTPVLLTVQVQWSEGMGVEFRKFGESLYLAEYIPVGGFTAPPLPKEKADDKKKEDIKEEPKPKTPGSFFIDFPDPEEKKRARHQKKKQDIIRDKEKKEQRKRKQKMWYPEDF